MSEEEQDRATGAMNEGYFVEDQRIVPDNIVSLQENQIFVFGSNIDGAHNGGAAYYALKHFGAKFGQAEGIQGQSYAIPTDGNSFEDLKKAVDRFTEYVVFHPQYKFMLTAVGTGNADYDCPFHYHSMMLEINKRAYLQPGSIHLSSNTLRDDINGLMVRLLA